MAASSFAICPAVLSGSSRRRLVISMARVRRWSCRQAVAGKIVRLSLTPAGMISGRIVDQFGEPVANAKVRAVPPGARPSVDDPALTDDTGRYVIGGLARGLYLVTAEAASVGATVSYRVGLLPRGPNRRRRHRDRQSSPASRRPGVDMTVTLVGKPSGYLWKELLSDTPDAGDPRWRRQRRVRTQPGAHDRATEARRRRNDTAPDEHRRRRALPVRGRAAGPFQCGRAPAGLSVPAQEPRRDKDRGGSSSFVPASGSIGLALVLAKSASISGRILDQFGDPMIGSVALRTPGSSRLPACTRRTRTRAASFAS